MNHNKTLHLTMGLPGCGKTSWAKELSKNNESHWNRGEKPYHIEYDEIRESNYGTKRTVIEQFKDRIQHIVKNYETIADSFISNTDGVISILEMIDLRYIENLTIHYWIPDKEACLWNDRGRRTEKAEITINNALIKFPDKQKIEAYLSGKKANVKIEIKKHTTERKPDWKVFFDENVKDIASLDEDGYIRSESWSLGGSWADCWGNNGSVSGEAQLSSFQEFDSILEKVCPNIGFLQYKNIYNQCVETGEKSEGDYYGGSVSYAYYKANLKNLYDILVEKNLYQISK